MLIEKKLCFLGAGNMGEALVAGLIGSGLVRPAQIVCTDVRAERLEELKTRYGVSISPSNRDAVARCGVIIYAVKPQILAEVLKETSPVLDASQVIISIAAGVPLSAIEAVLRKDLRLIRVMPNIAALVKESATALAAGRHARQEDIELAMAIFDAVGKTVFIGGDTLLDAVTGLSGSGPGYIFVIIEALADAGVKMGLSRPDAQQLAAQTLVGAARMLMETREHPGQLKDRVTSPGGTTIAGIHMLERGGLRSALIDAVEAATLRSKALGEEMIRKFAGAEPM